MLVKRFPVIHVKIFLSKCFMPFHPQLIKDGNNPDKPYITAKFQAMGLPKQFYLGNGQEYSSFKNRKLDSDDSYKVFLRAYSVDEVGITTET